MTFKDDSRNGGKPASTPRDDFVKKFYACETAGAQSPEAQ